VSQLTLLAIETSCDETAAAVVSETGDAVKPWRLRSNVVASQAAIHREWGGVVPELASRQHIRDICGVVERALADGGVTWTDLGAIAVTQGPGLVGSLLVGVAFAKSLAWAYRLPLVPVHHLAGHIESLVLQHGELPLPAAVLVVSGGHTSLYLISTPGHYQLIGRTRDDAAGEAYDKVARLLGLGYPGGKVLDDLARTGDRDAIAFPRGMTGPADDPHAFSFSGLKTAVARYVEKNPTAPQADVAAGFQEAVADVLTKKAVRAAAELGVSTLLIAGGVAANSRLRELAEERCAAHGLTLRIPRPRLCTDNGAMIASFAAHLVAAGAPPSPLDVATDPGLPVVKGQL
jgi:N6-L-threonylcarbamoyladenine synthase